MYKLQRLDCNLLKLLSDDFVILNFQAVERTPWKRWVCAVWQVFRVVQTLIHLLPPPQIGSHSRPHRLDLHYFHFLHVRVVIAGTETPWSGDFPHAYIMLYMEKPGQAQQPYLTSVTSMLRGFSSKNFIGKQSGVKVHTSTHTWEQ